MIPRHRTALSRGALSKPIRYAIADGLLTPGVTILDYGCGRGSDVARLQALGHECLGWDPHLAPDGRLQISQVVNLGYVINVIESQSERAEALKKAWSLTAGVLIVTARLKFDAVGQELSPFADGYLTTRGTFQKFFDHSELRDWIAQCVNATPTAAGPGIFYVFKDPAVRESFLASRQRRPSRTLRPSRGEILFEEHKQPFDEVLAFFSDRGRLPSVKECSASAPLYKAVARLDTIHRVIAGVLGDERFDRVVTERRQDLLVYLALSQFDRRQTFQKLPEDLQLDIRAFFPSYKAACSAANNLLFQVGDRARLDKAFQESNVGKLTANSLYIHLSSISELPTLLRLYEGCAKGYIGSVEGATLVKLHRFKAQVSYLSYPQFDKDPHPTLAGSLVVDLKRPGVRYFDYSDRDDPPVLHRKELFVSTDYPCRSLFAALTKSEDARGLLCDTANIGSKQAWAAVLKASGLTTKGHRLVRLAAQPLSDVEVGPNENSHE